MLHIQQAVAKIKKKVKLMGLLLTVLLWVKQNPLLGQKLYNQLLLDMIKMSDIPQNVKWENTKCENAQRYAGRSYNATSIS